MLTNGSGRSRTGIYHYYYTHPAKTKKNCRVPGLPAAKFEQAVVDRIAEVADDTELLAKACERANISKADDMERTKAELTVLREMEKDNNEKLDVLIDQIGTKQTKVTKPIEDRLEQISNTIMKFEQEIIESRLK